MSEEINKRYYRIMLGQKSIHAERCLREGFIGGDWGISGDLGSALPEDWREFNRLYIPKYLANNPGKSKVAAGLACGMLHTICKGIPIGSIILSPMGNSTYGVGIVTSNYFYVEGDILPHRRAMEWRDVRIARTSMSAALQNSTGSIGTVSEVTKHFAEIERLLSQPSQSNQSVTGDEVEDGVVFAMEKHLEEFLVKNWSSTLLGKTHDIYCEDGELIGQQYPTDTGYIDILAVSKDKRELLIVELKKGRASDSVVGQIQRYMGYVMTEVAESSQTVRGCIIALDDDLRIRQALKVNPSIDFYRYEVSFRLKPT